MLLVSLHRVIFCTEQKAEKTNNLEIKIWCTKQLEISTQKHSCFHYYINIPPKTQSQHKHLQHRVKMHSPCVWQPLQTAWGSLTPSRVCFTKLDMPEVTPDVKSFRHGVGICWDITSVDSWRMVDLHLMWDVCF